MTKQRSISAPATAATAAWRSAARSIIEFGGPSGGNGGRGGDVIIEVVDGLNTLIDYRYQQHFKAQKGTNGMGKDRHGANGKPIVLKVPVGTQIFDEDRETLIHDFTTLGEKFVLAEGGNGGFGNAHFKILDQPRAAQRQSRPGRRGALDLAAAEADRRRRPRRPAQCRQVDLPFRGQRREAEDRRLSLHDAASAARRGRMPTAANSCWRIFPGLIEGAHEGAGLGDRFLGHVERCRVLLHLVDATCEHAGKAYKTVRTELEAYEGQLADKIEIVALNKIDAVTPDELKKQKDRLKRAAKKTPLLISGATGEGVKEALRALVEVIGEAPVSGKAKSAAQAEPWAPADAAKLTSRLTSELHFQSHLRTAIALLQNSRLPNNREGEVDDRLCHARHQRSQESRRFLRQDRCRNGHRTLHGIRYASLPGDRPTAAPGWA